ncbi:MAG: uroporphyrinogen-III synthase [Saprospiraceae bacterium]|nr:uroporphyrinogen-III synthase [Saprospiraceae bacterium]
MRKVFISRDLDLKSPFRKELEKMGMEVIARSLFRYRAVDFGMPRLADWLFFNSPPSVHYFLKHIGAIPQNYQLAVLDSFTATGLQEHGLEAQFCGRGNLEEVAVAFLEQAQGMQAIFVQSRKSKQSIYKLVREQMQAEELVVYEYLPREDIQIPPCEIYVFTSPLNVKHYFERYLFPNGKQVVSTDAVTSKALKRYGITDLYQSEFSDEEGLAFAVRSLVKQV